MYACTHTNASEFITKEFVVESASRKEIKRGPHLPKATTTPTPPHLFVNISGFVYTLTHSETCPGKCLVVSKALESYDTLLEVEKSHNIQQSWEKQTCGLNAANFKKTN